MCSIGAHCTSSASSSWFSQMESRVRPEWIASAIQEFVETTQNGSHEAAASMANTVREMNALPLFCDWSGGVAIRPDGELIGFLWDEPESVKVETDLHLRFLACVAVQKNIRNSRI